jgi:hypothetical protein
VRVSVVEAGAVATELVSHVREGVGQAAESQVESIEPLLPEDIADAVLHIVTRDRRVAVNEVLVRVAEQTGDSHPHEPFTTAPMASLQRNAGWEASRRARVFARTTISP